MVPRRQRGALHCHALAYDFTAYPSPHPNTREPGISGFPSKRRNDLEQDKYAQPIYKNTLVQYTRIYRIGIKKKLPSQLNSASHSDFLLLDPIDASVVLQLEAIVLKLVPDGLEVVARL